MNGSFTGTDRRFQYKGEVAGVTIVDDYAHHPTEIELLMQRTIIHTKGMVRIQPPYAIHVQALASGIRQALVWRTT